MLILTVPLVFVLKKSCFSRVTGGFLLTAGTVETIASFLLLFPQGIFMGLLTWVFGFILFARCQFIKECSINIRPVLKKAVYLVLGIFIVLASIAISVRTTTNLIHEAQLQNYTGSSLSNLELKGTITSVALNQEVSIVGYVYHVFHACVTLNVTDFVWSSQMSDNLTSASNYWRNIGRVEVYYDWTDVSKLAEGQTVEVKGCYCPWTEDSIYSDTLVIDPAITDSYIKIVSN